MALKIFNVQRTSDGKTYQNDGTWGIGDNKDFISENYFDIPTNSWDLTNIDQVLYSARQLCIKRSKSSYPPKIV